MNTQDLQAAVDAVPFWYHRIELPGGVVTPGAMPIDAAAYRLPDDMTGQRVLDVGAWDGYWTFEALRRGAARVTAFDDFSDTCVNQERQRVEHDWTTLELCADALGARDDIDLHTASVYEPPGSGYDAVFFFGVLYHCKHPLLALERLREAMKDGGTLYLETAILDRQRSAYSDHGYTGAEPCMEFYPGSEYGLCSTCWWVPTLSCVVKMCEAAGFTVEDAWRLTDTPKNVAHCRGFVRATA